MRRRFNGRAAAFFIKPKKGDLLYDDIGSELKIRQIRKEKAELLQSLELYYKVFFLGEDVEG